MLPERGCHHTSPQGQEAEEVEEEVAGRLGMASGWWLRKEARISTKP
jgi:hypothetical protein